MGERTDTGGGPIGSEALRPNEALRPLSALVGEWTTVGSHPYLPGTTLHGRARFEWIEGGAFLLWRSEVSEPEVPSGTAVFGSDDATGELFLLYFDERGVSRKYDVSTEGDVIRLERASSDFSQRIVLTVDSDGESVSSTGEMSRGEGGWETDLELTYSRAE